MAFLHKKNENQLVPDNQLCTKYHTIVQRTEIVLIQLLSITQASEMSHTLKKYDNNIICMTIMCTPEDFLSSGKARSLD